MQKMELRGQQSKEVAENVRMSARKPGRETLLVPVTHSTTEFTCEAKDCGKTCKSRSGDT